MKKVLNLIALSTFFFSSILPALAAFSDVPNTNDNYLAVNYLSEQGIVKGYEDGTFKPDQPVNRAEALKIILEGNGLVVAESVEESSFTDVQVSEWYTRYIEKAKELGIVNGNPDGTFAPGRDVARAEFLKMLLNTNGFKTEKWEGTQIFADVPQDAWFTPFMNYAGQSGIISKDAQGNLNPGEALTRGEVAEILYLLTVILKKNDTQFLVSQAEAQMSQIDVYVGASNPNAAKRASELSVDMTQQAYKNLPEDTTVLGAAKLARAYDFVVNAYVEGIQKNYTESKDWADQAIAKATEAWEADNENQEIAKHIKDRANEIIAQIP